MSWLITPQQLIPAVIGEPFGGGYFAGYISHTADGNPTHALIVAPRLEGATGTGYTLTTMLAWKTTNTTTVGTTSLFDGAANTAAMVTAGIADHPAANFCKNLSIGGFTDWYLPATAELQIAFVNLKRDGTIVNNIGAGVNNYSVPPRTTNYTATDPAQTLVSLFANGGAEQFEISGSGNHSASTENGIERYRPIGMKDGALGTPFKTATTRVRAFRRIAL
jgi:hypothetical protein